MKNNIVLREPEISFDSLHQELNNFLRDSFMGMGFSHPLRIRKDLVWRPAIEMKQNDKEYKINVQLPGVDKEDIDIELENDYIKISAEVKDECEKEESEIKTCEFRYGKYLRTISLDNPIKTELAQAEYKNGILKINLPKQQIEKNISKKLSVK